MKWRRSFAASKTVTALWEVGDQPVHTAAQAAGGSLIVRERVMVLAVLESTCSSGSGWRSFACRVVETPSKHFRETTKRSELIALKRWPEQHCENTGAG